MFYFNENKIFDNFNNKKLNKNLNFDLLLKKNKIELKNMFSEIFGKQIINKKQIYLIKFEHLLKKYYFGKNGLFTDLIPNYRKELNKKAKKIKLN